jgi:hypothetical protein
MLRFWMLNAAGDPVATDDTLTWARWFETADRSVRQDVIPSAGGTVAVSTVFLGLDHNHHRSGPPVLWETLVFGGPEDGLCRRYTSKSAALAGHQDVIAYLLALVGKTEGP